MSFLSGLVSIGGSLLGGALSGSKKSGNSYAQAGGLTTPGAVSQGTVQSLPDWYTNYAKQTTNNALGMMANLPSYSGYTDALGNPAPMVAGLSGNQQKGIDTLNANVGGWKTGVDQAKSTAQSGIAAANAGLGTVGSASPMFGKAGDAYQSSLGTIDKAMTTFNQGQSQINSANGAIQNMGGALSKAAGYLDPAANYIKSGTNGSEFSADKLSQYTNPYLTGVNNEIARLANQNLTENVLPGVNSTFTGAGQFGSTRNGDFVARALRDNQATISGQQAKVLADAQAQGLQLAQGAADRNLQAGAQTGQLSNIAQGVAAGYGSQANTQINQGQATLGVGQGQLGAASGQQSAGSGFNQTGNNIVNQGQAQSQIGANLGNLASIQGALTTSGHQMGLSDAAAQMNAGAVEQATNQKGMDAAYRDFLDQRDYPLQALGALSQVMPGVSGRLDGNTQSMTLNSANAPATVSKSQALADILGGLSAAR